MLAAYEAVLSAVLRGAATMSLSRLPICVGNNPVWNIATEYPSVSRNAKSGAYPGFDPRACDEGSRMTK